MKRAAQRRIDGQLDERLAELAQRCRSAGLAVTPQRLAIFKELVTAYDHPSPELLHKRLGKRRPAISLATVYKTLDVLEQLGLAEEVSPVGDVKRYDANHRHHHHLVCTRCKRVSDFYDASFDALHAPRQLSGFAPETLTVQIKGLCAACSGHRLTDGKH